MEGVESATLALEDWPKVVQSGSSASGSSTTGLSLILARPMGKPRRSLGGPGKLGGILSRAGTGLGGGVYLRLSAHQVDSRLNKKGNSL